MSATKTCNHVDELVVHCADCKCTICEDCARKNHDGHKLVLLPEELERLSVLSERNVDIANGLYRDALETGPEMNKELEDIKRMTQEREKQMEEDSKKHLAEFDQLKKEIDAATSEVYQQQGYIAQKDPTKVSGKAVDSSAAKLPALQARLDLVHRKSAFVHERVSLYPDCEGKRNRWVEDCVNLAVSAIAKRLVEFASPTAQYLMKHEEVVFTAAVYSTLCKQCELLRREEASLRQTNESLERDVKEEMKVLYDHRRENAQVVCESNRIRESVGGLRSWEKMLRENCVALEGKKKGFDSEIGANEDVLAKAKEKLEEVQRECGERLRELESANAKLEKIKVERKQIRKELKVEMTSLDATKASLADTEKTYKKAVSQLAETTEKLESDRTKLEACREDLKVKQEELKQTVTVGNKEVAFLDVEKRELQAVKDKLEGETANAHRELEKLKATIKTEGDKAAELGEIVKKLGKDHFDLNTLLDAAKKELSELDGKFKESADRYLKKRKEIDQQTTEWTESRTKYDSEVELLKGTLANMRMSRTGSDRTVSPAVILSFAAGDGSVGMIAEPEASSAEIFKILRDNVKGVKAASDGARLRCLHLDNVFADHDTLLKTLKSVTKLRNCERVHVSSELFDGKVLDELAKMDFDPGLDMTLMLDSELKKILGEKAKKFNEAHHGLKIVFSH